MDHSILIKKLSIYKFSSSAIQWFKSYLNNRQQTIECDKGFTDFLNILPGVPQGSILGPTLFLLFINDLQLCFEHCSSYLYADDTTVHTKDSSVNNIEHNIMCDLKMLLNGVNLIKCSFIIVKPHACLLELDKD